MSQINLAYVAGIIDGEGDLQIKSRTRYNKTHRFAYIRISMTDKETIDFIYNIFKFGCRSITKRKCKNPKWSDLYVWETSYSKALIVIRKILPFLHTKRIEAENILSEFK
jgi:hypothetical protein